MKEVLDSGEYSDVQFLIVTAHRAILSSASDVFKTMFRYDVQNLKNSFGKDHATKKDPILVPDIEIEAFKAMLTFIYTMNFDGLDANNWLEVLKAANKYNITGLVKECADFCADFPIEKLSNVFVAFEQARLRNLEVLHWADEQCRQNDIECSADNRGKMLDKVFAKHSFSTHTKRGIYKKLPTGVLTIEEVDSIYQHYSHSNIRDVPGLSKLKFPTQQRYKSEGTIEMEIEKVSKFAREAVGSRRFSDAVEIGGFSWKMWAQITTKNENNEKWLGFFLYYDGSEKENLSCKSSATLRIVSQKNGTEDLIGKFNDHIFKDLIGVGFYNFISFAGWNNFISFAELMDPSKGLYNKDEDKVTLAIEFTCE
ncbi:hypothetical protein niasHT_009502 [Heterodera trifolii]|uniref:BTB domain-containing protein n=1 Tax=Heterodera trifolii TaxID=157864 RepID=A0ABD2M788_9BILA